jgi:hypothetical protein
MNDVLRDFLSFNQILNSVGYAFMIYFWFRINYELKTLKKMIESDIKRINNDLQTFREELELKDRKINLISQKFLTEIENLKTKVK